MVTAICGLAAICANNLHLYCVRSQPCSTLKNCTGIGSELKLCSTLKGHDANMIAVRYHIAYPRDPVIKKSDGHPTTL